MNKSNLETIVKEIVQQQSDVMGFGLAKMIANKKANIEFESISEITLPENTDPNIVITSLIESYQHVFGEPSKQVCYDVLKKYKTDIVGVVSETILSKVQ